MPRQEPRRFQFIPRFYKPERDKKVRIQRITLYEPHRTAGRRWLLIGLLLAVIIVIYLLGGIKPRAGKIELQTQDAETSIHGKTP